MSIKIYSFFLSIILVTSMFSLGLVFVYMNPENTPQVAFSIFGMASFLVCTSLLSFVLYFFKKIYYRGDVYVSTMHASVRQAILISLCTISTVALSATDILYMQLGAMIWVLAVVVEMIVQAVE